MKRKLLLISFTLFFLFGITQINAQTNSVEGTAYAGSAACQPCHSGQHTDWTASGHPYKIQKLENGLPPAYPAGLSAQKIVGPDVNYTLTPGVPQPPAGYTWADIGFVLGGYHSNSRFLNSEGYRIIGDSAQYNLITDKWVSYTQTTPGTAPYSYSCFKCHTTGGSPDSHPDFAAYPGIEGHWVETGVGCEGCHGPAADHIGSPSTIKPPKDGYATCNLCHARDRDVSLAWNERVQWRTQTVNNVETGFIRHREQGDMMLASGHANSLQCISCHSPHKGVYYELGGLKETVSCETCHQNREIPGHGSNKATCEDCHMPFAAKNGDVLTPYVSEQSAHFWRINTAAKTMFENIDTIDGKFFIKTDAQGKSALTLDYTCLQCHVNKDVAWANQFAVNMHQGITSVNDTEIPTAYTLTQNYPNPFNPSTTISFSIPNATHVTLSIYSVTGQLVETLVNEDKTPGNYDVSFTANNLASGVYIYRINTEQFVYSKKMILMK